MSVSPGADHTANERPHDGGSNNHRMTTEFFPERPASHLLRHVSNHVPLNFGSNTSSFQAPPFLPRSAPSPPPVHCVPSIAQSPESSSEARIASTSGSTIGPSTPTPIDMRAAPNILSSHSPTTSVCSVSSLHSRFSFTNLPPLKIPMSDASLPASFYSHSAPQPAGTYAFEPHLPNKVFEASRHTRSMDASTQTEPDAEDDRGLATKLEIAKATVAELRAERAAQARKQQQKEEEVAELRRMIEEIYRQKSDYNMTTEDEQ